VARRSTAFAKTFTSSITTRLISICGIAESPRGNTSKTVHWTGRATVRVFRLLGVKPLKSPWDAGAVARHFVPVGRLASSPHE
jgi:hypothetical protein